MICRVKRPPGLGRALLAWVLAALLAPSLARAKGPGTHDVCPRLRFLGKPIELTDMEKKLVCGDPGTDAWKNVSIPQAREFMTSFLQARGYHFPKFDVQDQTLEVSIGTTTYVKKLTQLGLGGIYDLGKRRQIVGRLLTPKLLDDVKKAVLFELQSRGYACPKVLVTADARTGEVHVDVLPGGKYRLADIAPARVQGVDPAAYGRFRAFEPGQLFDQRLLSLTGDRIKTDELFLSAYYDVDCSTGMALRITQHVVEGKPHLLTVGIGADTEGLVEGKLRAKQSRIGKRASSAELDLFASRLRQTLDASADLYLSDQSRLFISPEAFARREDEIQYEAAHSQVAVEPAWSHDGVDFHVEVRGGPAWDYFNTIRGEGPQRSNWAAFVTKTQIMTHLYEYYEKDPRRGWTATLSTEHRYRQFASKVTANKLQVNGEALWNIGHYEPPLLVAATRGLLGTTAVSGDPSLALTQVPPTDRFFLGGDADVRGFSRKRLPDDAAGFLTAAYEGLELRLANALPGNVQPLAFVDAAMGGRRAFHLDKDVYYSPGAGVRWAPPFGSIRATVARGLTWRSGGPTEPPRPHWQFFFSFGKEF